MLEKGQTVKAAYKSGEYLGEIYELKPTKAVVQIRAVLKHPTQGDLHHPYQADVPLFHQRRALAYQEKALVPLAHVQPYEGNVPEYEQSLRESIQRDKQELKQRQDEWGNKALTLVEQLEQEYFPTKKS